MATGIGQTLATEGVNMEGMGVMTSHCTFDLEISPGSLDDTFNTDASAIIRSKNERRRVLRREQDRRDCSVPVFRCCAGCQRRCVDSRCWCDSILVKKCGLGGSGVLGVDSQCMSLMRFGQGIACSHIRTPVEKSYIKSLVSAPASMLPRATHDVLERFDTWQRYKHSTM
jgi:hypothetical protein